MSFVPLLPVLDPPLLAGNLPQRPIISLLPSDDMLTLDEAAMQQINKQYRSKLSRFRLKNYMADKNFRMRSYALPGMHVRMK
jgi:hypothetical protein